MLHLDTFLIYVIYSICNARVQTCEVEATTLSLNLGSDAFFFKKLAYFIRVFFFNGY